MKLRTCFVIAIVFLVVACSVAPQEVSAPLATRTKPPTWTPEPSPEPSATFSPPPPSATHTATPQLNLTLAAQRQAVLQSTFGPVSTRPAGEPGKIAYEASEVLVSSEIFVMNPDGTNKTLLVSDDDGIFVGSPFWSPDGNYLGFTCQVHLCMVNFDGSNYREVTSSNSYRYFPSWMPDGNMIVFGKIGKDYNFDIYSLDVTNGAVNMVLPDAYAASWSPDGSQIAFLMLDSEGRSQMFIRKIEGGEDVKIWDFEVETLAWSSDGEYLVLSAEEEEFTTEHEIYVVRPDGSDLVKLTDNDWDDSFPVWSPDGTQIAFSSEQYGNYDIFVMNADGSNVRQLTTSSIDETTPAWQP